VDVLPTLMHLTGRQVPAWCEGQILPGLGGPEDPQRSFFMMDAKHNRAFRPLTYASFAMRKGPYKLIYYMGFKEFHKQDKFELYDLGPDPEELNDLYSESSPVAMALRDELLAKVREVSGQPGMQ
jgi:arylsulfatase A-like enzyme